MSNSKNYRIQKLIFTLVFLSASILFFRNFKEVDQIHLTLTGNHRINKKDIFENSSLQLPQKLIEINTTFTARELKENLSLKNIYIKKNLFPFGLEIFIEERTPVALGERLENGKIINGFIDKDGYFINLELSALDEKKLLEIKVFGWKKKFIHEISKILYFNKSFENRIEAINISSEGFITLKEKSFKKIIIGSDPKKLDQQLISIKEIRNQLMNKKNLPKILSLDITDPSNPEIKVFKP